jgi:hypothetical protein
LFVLDSVCQRADDWQAGRSHKNEQLAIDRKAGKISNAASLPFIGKLALFSLASLRINGKLVVTF